MMNGCTQERATGPNPSNCDRLFGSVVNSLALLLETDETQTAVGKALTALSKGVDVDRVYVFEIHRSADGGELLSSQRYEWCADRVQPQIDNPSLQNHPIQREFPRWIGALSSGETISGPVADFPSLERTVLEQQEIVSLIVVPIMIGNALWGFLGFDDCRLVRSWTKAEELSLKAAATGIGNAIVRHRSDAALRSAHDELERKVRERTRELESANRRLRLQIEERKSAEAALAQTKAEMERIVEERTAELIRVNQQMLLEISVRREAQEVLHEKEQEFRALVEHAPDVIMRMDRDLRILYANPAVQSSTGYPTRWFKGRSIDQIGLPRHTVKRVRGVLQTVFSKGREKTLTLEYRAADSTTKFFQFRLVPEYAKSGGKVETVLGIGRDITAKRTLEERLMAASKAKDQFLANMSHELRTPLGGILGMMELLLMEELPPRVRNDLGIIDEAAKSLLHIINDILDLSRIEAGKLELQHVSFDLGEMLTRSLMPLSLQADAKGLRYRLKLSSSVPAAITSDPIRLGQILRNFVSNAVKFTQDGDIDVRVCRLRPSGDGNRIKLAFSVVDTGIGIAASDQRKLFKSFIQLDSSISKRYGGVGLGLYISRQLARHLGGEIRVKSQPGKGSRFTFIAEFDTGTLPAPEIPVHEQPCPSTPLTILLAEDNPVNTAYITRFLKAEGHNVVPACNGIEALEALRNGRFDLVLMDVQMPELDGLEATRLIRSAQAQGVDPTIPIVALTAYAMKDDRQRFLTEGMDDCITKPVNFNELRSALLRVAASR
jgi:PAS domain S-box-containing protein